MNLRPIGTTAIEPRTYFFWHNDTHTTVEITDLGDEYFLVRASKSYRLLKQDESTRRETWSRNISKLNDYLADTFSSFQITAAYTDEITPEATGIRRDARQLNAEAQELANQKNELVEETEKLETGLEHGLEQLETQFEDRLENANQGFEAVERRLEKILQKLQQNKQELDVWRSNGVMLAYLFTFSTDPQITSANDLDRIVDGKIDESFNRHRRKIKQTLKGSKFKLEVEELDEPRTFQRVEHTSLLNPDNFDRLVGEHPELKGPLSALQEDTVAQYETYALDDIETDAGVIERSKATPARAIRSLITRLDTIHLSAGNDIPFQGPMVGTLPGTRQTVGFDPADSNEHGMPHMYIVGGTGSGKTYLKRVLIENAASLSYDILCIIPGEQDLQGLGLSFPNPEHNQGRGIVAEHYVPSDGRFPDIPDRIDELLTGVNVVTLSGLTDEEKQGFAASVFERLDDLEELTTPLFVFVEEAHNFADQSMVTDAIEQISRAGRKFGIHLVLVTQHPTDFSYSEADIRDNLKHIFLENNKTQYANKFLESGQKVTSLKTGHAIFGHWNHDEITVDIRRPLTLAQKPDNKQIDELTQRYRQDIPEMTEKDDNSSSEYSKNEKEPSEIETTGTEKTLSNEEIAVLDYVRRYTKENDQAPTHSKCWRPDDAPLGQNKSKKILQKLVETGLLEREDVVRGGNNTQAYRPV